MTATHTTESHPGGLVPPHPEVGHDPIRLQRDLRDQDVPEQQMSALWLTSAAQELDVAVEQLVVPVRPRRTRTTRGSAPPA